MITFTQRHRVLVVVTAISTIPRAATGDCDPVYDGISMYRGVAYRITHILPKSHAVMVDFCEGHRVTGMVTQVTGSFWTVAQLHL